MFSAPLHRLLLAGALSLVMGVFLLGQAPKGEREKFQAKVDKAIDRGVSYLISLQQRDGSWAHYRDRYRNGQTALAAYTLLKCDVPRSHPALVRAFEFLERKAPKHTYSVALQMMAYEATHDPKYHPEIKRFLKLLMEWQKESWGYPDLQVDLSNTQYAALGLRAAHLAGFKIPKRVIRDLMEHIFAYQNRPVRRKLPPPPKGVGGYDRAGRDYAPTAGYRYRMGPSDATGSMTTAGLGVLAICDFILGDRMPKGLAAKSRRSMRMGINWLRCNWSVKGNPGRKSASSHHHYYLYGLERVGSLLMKEILADHPWYREGAELLVKTQRGDGAWVDGGPRYGGLAEHTTCFGLLFLKRATNVGITGRDITKRGVRNYRAVDSQYEVSLRGVGDAELTLWIEGFAYSVLDAHRPKPGAKPKLRVLRVEYLVDGKVVRTVDADRRKVWKRDNYAVKYRFTRKGKYKVSARVYAAAPRGSSGPNTVVYHAPGFEVTIDETLLPWMSGATAKSDLNRFASGKDREFSASSVRWKGNKPNKAFDGLENTLWLSAKEDKKNPWIRIGLKTPVRIHEIRLGQACRNSRERRDFDRIKRVRIEFNGNKRKGLEFDLEKDPLVPTVIKLRKPRVIRSLVVRILDRDTGKKYPGCAGFAEIIGL